MKNFLEHKCGLSTENPIDGRIVSNHKEAFYFWRELIESNAITEQFEVVHVDAHSDLSYGWHNLYWIYLLGELLHKPIEERMYDKKIPKKMNCANYLAFAVACRWINKITFVTHAQWKDDLTIYFFRDSNPSTGYLELPCYKIDDIENRKFHRIYKTINPLFTEPPIPFITIPHEQYKNNKPFSFITFSTSPPFTPPTADPLVEIIESYINPI